jgi:tetratricopeptide (TPR) repeat protein
VIAALSTLSIYAWISRGEAVQQRLLAEKQKDVALNAFYQLTYEVPNELARFPGTEKIRERMVRETIASLAKLQQLTPVAPDIRRELATNHRLLGTILIEAGRFQDAQAEFKKSAGFYSVLLKGEPGNALWNRDLATSLFNSGLMLEKLGDKQGACREYGESIKYARTAAEQNQQFADILTSVENGIEALSCLKGK